jgi:hypothetical protein
MPIYINTDRGKWAKMGKNSQKLYVLKFCVKTAICIYSEAGKLPKQKTSGNNCQGQNQAGKLPEQK